MKRTRLSTCGAKLEACSGYNGICDCTISPLLGGSNSVWPRACRAGDKSRSSTAIQRLSSAPARDNFGNHARAGADDNRWIAVDDRDLSPARQARGQTEFEPPRSALIVQSQMPL